MSKFIRSNLVKLNQLKDKESEGANKTTQKKELMKSSSYTKNVKSGT